MWSYFLLCIFRTVLWYETKSLGYFRYVIRVCFLQLLLELVLKVCLNFHYLLLHFLDIFVTIVEFIFSLIVHSEIFVYLWGIITQAIRQSFHIFNGSHGIQQLINIQFPSLQLTELIKYVSNTFISRINSFIYLFLMLDQIAYEVYLWRLVWIELISVYVHSTAL